MGSNRCAKTAILDASLMAGVLGVISALRGRWSKKNPAIDYTDHGFDLRSVRTPTGKIVYYEAGDGQPLVFLHGIGGGASSWMWSKVAPAFTNRYRVIVPDWVGWGASEHPRRYLMPEDYVAELRVLLRSLADGAAGGPAVVVAQSLAAGFAARLAGEEPGLFAGLLMTTPSGGKDLGEDKFGPVVSRTFTPVARTPVLRTVFYRLVFPRRAFLRWWSESQGFYNAGAVSREIVDGWLWSARKPGAEYSALPFLTGELRFDIAPYLRTLNTSPVPAAMIWGAEERQVGIETGQRLAAANPGIPLTILPLARNTFELELPAQTITLVERFLRELPQYGARSVRTEEETNANTEVDPSR